MMRRWARGGVMLSLLTLVGCGSDSRDGLIRSTSNQMAEASNSVEAITTKLKDYLKSKEGRQRGDRQEGPGRGRGGRKKAEGNRPRIPGPLPQGGLDAGHRGGEEGLARSESADHQAFAETLVTAGEKHREMKDAVAQVTKKYGEEPLHLLQEIQEADTEFAAITRKR